MTIQRLLLAIGLSLSSLAAVPSEAPPRALTENSARKLAELKTNESFALGQQLSAGDTGRALAEKVPRPIQPAGTSPVSASTQGRILARLFTIPGAIVAAVTLVLTVVICRPRK